MHEIVGEEADIFPNSSQFGRFVLLFVTKNVTELKTNGPLDYCYSSDL